VPLKLYNGQVNFISIKSKVRLLVSSNLSVRELSSAPAKFKTPSFSVTVFAESELVSVKFNTAMNKEIKIQFSLTKRLTFYELPVLFTLSTSELVFSIFPISLSIACANAFNL